MALLATVPGAAGQGVVHATTFRADLTGAGAARVEVVVELRGVAAGARVPVSLLDFRGSAAWDVRVGRDGAPVEIPVTAGAARGASLPVEEGADGEPVVRLTYRVPLPAEDGGGVVAHLPVATVDLAPQEARPGLFQGTVVVPAGWVVTEGFPTGMTAVGEDGRHQVALQVVPSVVTVRARVDGARRPGLPLLLDAVAVGGLLLFFLLGWRHLGARPA